MEVSAYTSLSSLPVSLSGRTYPLRFVRSHGYKSPLNPLLAPILTLVNYTMTNIGKTDRGLHGACSILPPGWAVTVRCGNGLRARDTAQRALFAIPIENITDVDQTWTVTFSNPCLQGCT